MSKPVKILWPLADTSAVALPQTLAAAGNLVINGSLSVNEYYSGGSSSPLSGSSHANFPNIRRTVTLTSTGDLSGVNFTITGYTDNLRPISDVIVGPNNETVSTDVNNGKIFTKVTSISADAAVGTAVSAGVGTEGATIWYRNDYHRIKSDLTVAVAIEGDVDYTFETTLDDPEIVAEPIAFPAIDGITIPTLPANTPMDNAIESIVADYIFPTHSSRIKMNSSGADGVLTIWFLQQGIK